MISPGGKPMHLVYNIYEVRLFILRTAWNIKHYAAIGKEFHTYLV